MSIKSDVVFYSPCLALQPFVRYIYTMRCGRPHSVLTFPTGCPQIIFHRREPLFIPELNATQSRFTISGQVNFPSHVTTNSELEMIVTVFYPHTIGLFIDTPPSQFYNTEISGHSLGSPGLSRLASRVFSCESTDDAVRLIESFLTAKIAATDVPHNLARIGSALLTLTGSPTTTVARLADTACLGKKQFERVFRSYVGMNPKEYARIVRFQKSLAMMGNGCRDYADIAFGAGYSDQSHLIREVRTFSGLTPRRLAETGQAHSDLFHAPA